MQKAGQNPAFLGDFDSLKAVWSLLDQNSPQDLGEF